MELTVLYVPCSLDSGLGFRVQGLGLRFQDSGLRWNPPFTKSARCLPFIRVSIFEFIVQGAGCRSKGSGCRVQGAGWRVQGVGCGLQLESTV